MRIVCSSVSVGNRQSQCPAKHALFSAGRKLVNTVPSAFPPAPLHENRSSLSWTLPSSRFCSHQRPVNRSVTVPSPLSTSSAPSHVDPVPFALPCSRTSIRAYTSAHLPALSWYLGTSTLPAARYLPVAFSWQRT